jgi:hypothetical protein
LILWRPSTDCGHPKRFETVAAFSRRNLLFVPIEGITDRAASLNAGCLTGSDSVSRVAAQLVTSDFVEKVFDSRTRWMATCARQPVLILDKFCHASSLLSNGVRNYRVMDE